MRPDALSRTSAILLLGIVIVAWGTNWSVSKALLQHLPPVWATALRMIPACVALWAICIASGKLVIPRRGDLPVIPVNRKAKPLKRTNNPAPTITIA